MFATLREVVEYYNHPDRIVQGSINRDKALDTPLDLSEEEINDLVAFLESLTDDRFTKRWIDYRRTTFVSSGPRIGRHVGGPFA